MNQVRIHGDPFGDDPAAGLLRSFLRLSLGSGMRCTLSLTEVRPREVAAGERAVPLTDGVRNLEVGTRLPPAEIELLLRAAGAVVAATAPVVVFAARGLQADAARLAGLEWPRAAVVIVAREGATAGELLERVRAELRWAGPERAPYGLGERDLQPWLSLPALPQSGVLVHVGSADPADGTDLVLTAWAAHFATAEHPLRLVLPSADEADVARLLTQIAPEAALRVEVVRSDFEPAHARDCTAVVLPWRQLQNPRVLVQALASGRPVCVSRFHATAPIVGRHGVCLPIGGRNVPQEAAMVAHFEPHPRALVAALRQAVGDGAAAAAIGRKARQHVVEELTNERPASPPAPLRATPRTRPTVVLEAPFLETSSSAELSIATAQALLRRDTVDLQLVPTVPLRCDLAAFRRRAPDLEPLLCRAQGTVDLWLSSGWPVRAVRPDCRTHALRVDWEYGSLPLELTPHVTQEADCVVVHSEFVYRTITSAGRPMPEVKVVPHGVDAAMHELAPPDPRIVAWKQGRPAVLFCGGLVWRKGFDVFLRAVLDCRASGIDLCVVVKTIGHDQHYGRFHLGELARRFQDTTGTPPLLLLDGELSRDELASVYTACDVLVHPYRGEGFCLPVLEARACGLPVLATGGGATDALMAGPGAMRIPAVRRELELPQAHVSQPWLLEPSAEELAKLLVDTLRDLPARRLLARNFARSVRTAFPWDAAAQAIEQLAAAAMQKRRVGLPAAAEPLVTLPHAPAKGMPEPRVPARS